MHEPRFIDPQIAALRRVTLPPPEGFPILPEYLSGLTPEQFRSGFGALYHLVLRAYDDMAARPENFGLPQYPVSQHRVASEEARDSDRAVRRWIQLLYCLGGAARAEDGLSVNKSVFDTLVKATGLKNWTMLMGRLADYGMAFPGWNGRRMDAARPFTLACPAQPALPVALAALARSCPPQPKAEFDTRRQFHFISLHAGLLACPPGQTPGFAFEDYAGTVSEADRPFLRAFHRFLLERGLQGDVEDSWYKLRYLDEKNKPTLDYFRVTDYRYPADGQLLLRLKLNHAALYNDEIEALPEPMKNGFRTPWRCGHCRENCNRRVVYRIDGELQERCLCDAFAFMNPHMVDLPHYERLFDLERQARAGQKKAKK